jgi:hypothetical protein
MQPHVANLKGEITEAQAGLVFKPQDSSDLTTNIEKYLKERIRNLEIEWAQINVYANERYS